MSKGLEVNVMSDELLALQKPTPQHTVLITCKGAAAGGESGCKRKRWVKPQDAWQVKLCLPCKAAKDEAKRKTSFVKMKAKVEAKAEIKAVVKSLDWRAIREAAHAAGMAAAEKYRTSKVGAAEIAAFQRKLREGITSGLKSRRVWPV